MYQLSGTCRAVLTNPYYVQTVAAQPLKVSSRSIILSMETEQPLGEKKHSFKVLPVADSADAQATFKAQLEAFYAKMLQGELKDENDLKETDAKPWFNIKKM